MIYGEDNSNPPSRFINEIDEKLIKTNQLANTTEIKPKGSYYNDSEIEYRLGDIVNHKRFGHGVVVKIKDDKLIEIAFRDGVKIMAKNHKDLEKV